MNRFTVIIIFVMFHSFIVNGKIIYQKNSLYSNIFIHQENSIRCLAFNLEYQLNESAQSCIDLKNPDHLLFLSYRYLVLIGLLYNSYPKKILMIGHGGGTLARSLNKILPSSHITIVEIDKDIFDVSKKYFSFKENKNLKTIVTDGRVFVKKAKRKGYKYDWIILDAFTSNYVPAHMMTFEFLTEVRGILSERGLVTSNTLRLGRLYDHESVTYKKVFKSIYSFDDPESIARIIVAPKYLPIKSMKLIKKNSTSLKEQLKQIGIQTTQILPSMIPKKDWDPTARIITDQFSPVNLLRYDFRKELYH